MSRAPQIPTVVTLGVFDGVHRGHQSLLHEARLIADHHDAHLLVASFNPHPVAVLRPDTFLGLLTLPARRADLLRALGADSVEFLPFDAAVSLMVADEFVNEVIVQGLNADVVVVGENFRFGHRAHAGVPELMALGDKYGFSVDSIPLSGDGQVWSSTRIRQSLLSGDVGTARTILGRAHRLTGEVVHGDHRGRELGFPTANLAVPADLIVPADGIYATTVAIDGKECAGALSIGTNPTFEDVFERRVEVFILDQPGLDLYGLVLDVDIVERVRGTEKFDSLGDLLLAMDRDIVKIREVLANQPKNPKS